jgi:hypothetical protein
MPSQTLRVFARFCSLVVVVLVLSGCGASHVPVAGKVVLDGQPLTSGSVAFHPATGSGNEQLVGRSEIDAQGQYKLWSNGKEGVAPGSYKVVVNATRPTNPNDPYSPVVPIVDKKFTSVDSTPLTVDVAAGNGPDKYELTVTK